jgi:hypothetical protein
MSLISNEVIQADFITALKGRAALTTLLSSGAVGVKEDQYQGKNIGFPAVRYNLIDQRPYNEREQCTHSILNFSIRCYAEGASSKKADQVAGVVVAFLHRYNIQGTGWYGFVRTINTNGAVRITEDLWMTEAFFQANVYPAVQGDDYG